MSKTEADLEARIHTALRSAFPWISDLEHQTFFSVRLGHATVRVDGSSAEKLSGRADILVSHNKKPLAILELKREDINLSGDDIQQGLSYARLTNPMTPLVIVSNGKEFKIYDTYSGKEWESVEKTDKALQKLLENTFIVATSTRRDAIQKLMNSNQQHWIDAFKQISSGLINDRAGDLKDMMVPYVNNFLLPRHATKNALDAIGAGKRAIVISGPPLSGKSNVLRELFLKIKENENLTILMLESSTDGIFETLSNQLSSFLDWNVSADDAREWIRRVSNGDNADLIIALDGIDPAHNKIISELNELVSSRFGSALRLIITLDDSALEAVTKKPTGREYTPFGRMMHLIPVGPLNDEEFKQAQLVLAENRILITPGGESVIELREPWILRALVPSYLEEVQSDDCSKMVQLPPLLDIESLEQAAKGCKVDVPTQTYLKLVAKGILSEYVEPRADSGVIYGITTFAVSHHRLESIVGTTGIRELKCRGLIKQVFDHSDKPVWNVRIPVLVARYLALELSEQVSGWGTSEEIAKKLVHLATKLPIGEVIVASAIVQYLTLESKKSPLDLLQALQQLSPKSSTLGSGSEFTFAIEGQLLRGTVSPDGTKLMVSINGSSHEVDLLSDDSNTIMDFGGWLILSHVASMPIGIEFNEDGDIVRIDETLLFEVAQSPFILSRPYGPHGFKEVITHDIPSHGSMVCHQSGVIEPITWALIKYFIGQSSTVDLWIKEAMSQKSLPLLSRIHIALNQVSKISGERGTWARQVLSSIVIPEFENFPMHT